VKRGSLTHNTPYILTRGSRPEAVLISYDQYVKFARPDEAGVLKRMEAALARMAELNEQYTEQAVAADLAQATRLVRSRKRR
jgi:PHD/YefM family antitoxin component YafN of YafNO toxin-antitoxin module